MAGLPRAALIESAGRPPVSSIEEGNDPFCRAGRDRHHLRVVVCVKQVPDTGEMRVDAETNRVIRDGVAVIINPFDEYAIEEGIRVKERLPGVTLAAVSMGPVRAQEALREAVARGADEGILLSDEGFAGSDAGATAYVLAKGIIKVGDVGLVICGKQSSDGATGQVGPALAEELGFAHITQVRKIRELTSDRIEVERLLEDGIEIAEAQLPVVISVVKEINEPGLPALKGIMKAKKTAIVQWRAVDLGVDAAQVGSAAARAQVERTWTPEGRRGGELIEGEPAVAAGTLVAKLREAKLL